MVVSHAESSGPSQNLSQAVQFSLATAKVVSVTFHSELLQRLADQSAEPTVISIRCWTPTSGLPTLADALGISDELMSDQAMEALSAIQELVSEDPEAWHGFLWKCAAFARVHEAFDGRLHLPSDSLALLEQYYFYFESQILLAESVLAALNGLYAAADALLRPFIEFTLLQCYYWRTASRTGSYSSIRDYFKTARHPAWGTAVRGSLPADSFCKPVKRRLQSHLSGLSQSSSHPHHPSLSPVRHRKTSLGPSLDGLFFWLKTEFAVTTALWMYYANFPLLFHPVDRLRKFGFAGPVGVVEDEACGESVRRSLSVEDYEAFSRYAAEQDTTVAVLEWFNALPNLDDGAVRATWDQKEDGPFPGIETGYAIKKAKFHSLLTAVSLAAATQPAPQTSTSAVDFSCLSGWREFQVRRGKGQKRGRG